MTRPFNAEAIANKFLDLWEEEHTGKRKKKHPDYDRLSEEFANLAGNHITIGEVVEVRKALERGRQSRGWPGEPPALTAPTIEGAIMALWGRGVKAL